MSGKRDESPRSTFPWHRIALLGVMIVALILRGHHLGASSYWLDELFALELSTGRGFGHEAIELNALPSDANWTTTQVSGFHPVSIWTKQVGDSHPPLYFVVLGLWRVAFGSGEVAVRSLSVLFSLATIYFIYQCIRIQSRQAPALWTAAILALSGTQIQYAQEARNYTMASAVLYALLWMLLLAGRDRSLSKSAAVGIGLLLWAGAATHYLFIAPAAAAVVYFVIRFSAASRRRLVIAATAAVMFFAATWLPFFLAQRANGFSEKITWMGHATGSPVFHTIAQLQSLVWDNLVLDQASPEGLRLILSLLLLFPLMGMARLERVRVWLVVALAGLGFVILSDWIDGTNRLSVTRYTVLLTPAIWASIIVYADLSRVFRHLLPVLVIGLCTLQLREVYVDRKADWRSISHWLSSEARPDDLIVFTASPRANWVAGACQAAIGHYAHWERAPDAMAIDHALTSDVLAQMHRPGRRTIVVSPQAGLPPDDIGKSLSLRPLRAFDPTMAFYILESPTTQPQVPKLK